jgi:hypothetical protein
MSKEAVDLLVRSWQPETYRHMRHSWTELSKFLEATGVDEEELLGPSGPVHLHNFKAAYASTGKGSVEAVFSHCNTLRATLCGDGTATASRLLRAVRRAKPKRKKRFDSIWSLRDLAGYIRREWPVNDELQDDELLTKALALTMLFTACRLEDLATMELREDAIKPERLTLELRRKTSLDQISPVEVKPTHDEPLCPYNTIVSWFGRRAHSGGLLFSEPGSGKPLTSLSVATRLEALL